MDAVFRGAHGQDEPIRSPVQPIRSTGGCVPSRGVFDTPLAAPSLGYRTLSNILERYRTIGDFRRVDCLASGPSAFQAWRRRSTSSTSLGDTAAPSPKAFVTKPPTRTLGKGPAPEGPMRWARIGFGRPSFPTTGLKPIADGIRRMLPFGSPKGTGQHDQTRRNTEGDARSQVGPSHGGTDPRVHRQGRGRDRPPLRPRG